MTRKHLAPHFFVSKNLDGFIVSAHQDEKSYDEAYDEMARFYSKIEYFTDDPLVYKMKISDINVIKDLDFLPITIKILGFDPDVPIKDQK